MKIKLVLTLIISCLLSMAFSQSEKLTKKAHLNAEKIMPRNYITRDGFHITEKARAYFAPLIQGEDYPVYKHGIPRYARLAKILEKKKLKKWKSA